MAIFNKFYQNYDFFLVFAFVIFRTVSFGVCKKIQYIYIYPELQIRGSTEDNSKIIFLISQEKHML